MNLWNKNRVGKEFFLLSLVTIASLLIRGYKYRNTFMLPYSYHYLDPSLFSKDIAFFNYNLNFFFIINAYLSKIVSYETLFFIGYVISSFLVVAGVYYLAKMFFDDRKVAYLAAILTITVKPALSAMTTWGGNYYYYKDLAMGVLLISLALFLRKKYLWSFLLTGIASFIHILFALYFAGFYGLYFLYLLFKKEFPEAKKMILGMILLGLFLAPPVYLILSSEQEVSSPEEFSSWLSIIKLRSFDHFFPSTWITNSVILFLPLLVLFIIFLITTNKKKYSPEPPLPANTYKKELNVLTIYIALLGIVGIIFSELIPIRFLIITQLFRPTILLTFFALMFGSYLIISNYDQFTKKRSYLLLLVTIPLFIALFYYDFKLLLLILPLTALFYYQKKLTSPLEAQKYLSLLKATIILTLLGFLLTLISLAFPSFLYLPFYGEQIFRLPTISYLLLGILFMGAFIIIGFNSKLKPRRTIIITTFFIIIALLTSFTYAAHQSTVQSDDPCYTPSSWFDFTEHFQYPEFTKTSMYNLSLWALENTPKAALFMLPVECGSDFRNFAQRSVFADFKYGTMSTFSVKFGIKWFERIQDLNPQRKEYHYHTFYQDIQQDYASLTEIRIRSLAEKYNLDYGVFRKPKKLNFPVIYENHELVVYLLRTNKS